MIFQAPCIETHTSDGVACFELVARLGDSVKPEFELGSLIFAKEGIPKRVLQINTEGLVKLRRRAGEKLSLTLTFEDELREETTSDRAVVFRHNSLSPRQHAGNTGGMQKATGEKYPKTSHLLYTVPARLRSSKARKSSTELGRLESIFSASSLTGNSLSLNKNDLETSVLDVLSVAPTATARQSVLSIYNSFVLWKECSIPPPMLRVFTGNEKNHCHPL
jgi:hypothetical protein